MIFNLFFSTIFLHLYIHKNSSKMEDDLALGFCIIKVLCLIVIAMSVHKLAYSNEYFESGRSGDMGASASMNPRHHHELERSMFNNAEPPVFWNQGNAESINAALQAAASGGVDSETYGVAGQTAAQVSSGFGNRSFATGENLNEKLGLSLVGY